MTATTTASMPIAAFDPFVTPTQNASGSTVVAFSGTTSDPAQVANIELYSRNNGSMQDLGGTGQIATPVWNFSDTLSSAGTYTFNARIVSLTGTSVINSPFELITGIKGQPYVTQELTLNSQNVVTSVTGFDASGNIVYQTTNVGGAAATALPHISFDSTSTFESASSATLTGTTTAPANVSSIVIFDGTLSQTVDPTTGAVLSTAKALGTATLSTNGTWSFDANVSPGQHEFTAVATTFGGSTTAAQSSYELSTGIVGKPYVFQEIDQNAAGKAVATISYASNGSVVGQSASGGVNLQSGTSAGQVIHSSSNDVMTGSGGSTTFVFTPGFGQDEITNFNYASGTQAHDIISVPKAEFQSMAQLFHHITTGLDGSAVLHLNPSNSIKIDGVTKAELITHSSDFRFHG